VRDLFPILFPDASKQLTIIVADVLRFTTTFCIENEHTVFGLVKVIGVAKVSII
jgi:hypothetical protein